MTILSGRDFELGNYYEVSITDLNELRLWFTFTILHVTPVMNGLGYAEIVYTIVIDGRVA